MQAGVVENCATLKFLDPDLLRPRAFKVSQGSGIQDVSETHINICLVLDSVCCRAAMA
jgi:hypothetical protein